MILLTGSSGFIGKHIYNILKKYYGVIPFDKKCGKDLLNIKQLEKSIQKCEIVVHAAAEANFENMEVFDKSYSSTSMNIQGTHNIAHLCSKHEKKLIFISTCCVYGNASKFVEEIKVYPKDLYSFSKLAGENIIFGYHKNFDLQFIILRIATCYGPNMRPELGIAKFIYNASKNIPLPIHGNGKQTRTFTHVYDIAQGVLKSIKFFNIAKNNIINISTTEQTSALQAAKDIIRLCKSKSPLQFVKQRKHQIFKENVSNHKAMQLLKWFPKYNWQKGICQTIKTYVNQKY